MAEWRVGRKLGVTLYRDEVFVGHVNGPEIAAEIVEAMEVRERVRDRAARNAEERSSESGRERSPEPIDCPACLADHYGLPDGAVEHNHEDERPEGCVCAGCIGMGPCDDDLGKSDDTDDEACTGLDCNCRDCRAEWSEYER